jgi:hypothetical protein
VTSTDEAWDAATSSALRRLADARDDWLSISERDQELAALWKLEADLYNGGFLQFFCNWGPQAYEIACRALHRCLATELLSLVQRAYAILARHEDHPLQNLWDLAKVMTDTESDELAVIDDAAAKAAESLRELACTTYELRA